MKKITYSFTGKKNLDTFSTRNKNGVLQKRYKKESDKDIEAYFVWLERLKK